MTKRFAFLLAFILLGSAVAADAQTRRTTRKPAPPKVVTSSTLPANAAAERKAGAEKAAVQIKNVSRFIFLLGGVAKGIEDIDKDPRANRAAKDANETNKRELVQAIRNLEAGLQALEIEFRTKETLKKHVPIIGGITELARTSGDLAAAGRLTEAGRPLLDVVEKLSDTLVAMP